MEFTLPSFWLNLIIFIVGSAVLVKGSDWFIDAASGLARIMKVSELVIGLTVVSIGTSLPELATSVYAAFKDDGDFIIGNIVGSNITNILLILGVGILASGQMLCDRQMFKRDIPLMNVLFLIVPLLLSSFTIPASGWFCDGTATITRPAAALLLLGAIGYCFWLFRSPDAPEEAQVQLEHTRRELWKFIGLLVVGFVMVLAGAKAMVDPVIWCARELKIDPMLISVTVVAFGTSVPELAVTVAGMLKHKNDIAVGNIVGSCIFNILLIFGLSGLVSPIKMLSASGIVNAWLMLPTGLLLALFMLSGKTLKRWQGAIFLLGYCGFLAWNIHTVL